MPAVVDVNIRSGVLYLVLLLAIPIQYYISNQMSVPSPQRDATFRKLMYAINGFRYKYLSVNKWQQWCWNLMKNMEVWKGGRQFIYPDDIDEGGESPALEVLKHANPEGHFGTSTEVRSQRPNNLLYRVGQVIQHKKWNYRGVIIGWDLVAKAPERWLDIMHPVDMSHWRRQPNYAILVDTRDRKTPQITYVPQENIEVITQAEIEHPSLFDYFDSFDGAQYIMRPAWKYFYPKD